MSLLHVTCPLWVSRRSFIVNRPTSTNCWTHTPQLVSCDHRVLVCWRSWKLPSKHLTGHSPMQRQQLGTVRTATTTPQFTRLLKTLLFTLGWSRTISPALLTHYLLMNYGAVIQIDDWLIDWLIDRVDSTFCLRLALAIEDSDHIATCQCRLVGGWCACQSLCWRHMILLVSYIF